MAARSITAYLPIEGAVVRLGMETDERGRAVTIWSCPGCPTTCRTLAVDAGPASAFMTDYGSHPDCTFHTD
jgi:hypothetical protein